MTAPRWRPSPSSGGRRGVGSRSSGSAPAPATCSPTGPARELRRASVLVGLDQYVDQIRDLLRPGTRVLESGLGDEEARARTAVDEARAGHAVALIGSGDAGVYAMASPALEMLARACRRHDRRGRRAGRHRRARRLGALGAPLGHDHVAISLSDLHTPWPAIEQRVRAAAEADFVVTFYNPRSRGRDWQLPQALELLGASRPPRHPRRAGPGRDPAGRAGRAHDPGQGRPGRRSTC